MTFTMKSISAFLILLLIIALGADSACSNRERVRVMPLSDLEQSKPFKATVELIYSTKVEGRDVVFIDLRTESGQKIGLGGDNTNTDVLLVGFARQLTNGATYLFPEKLLSYKERLNLKQ